MVGEEIPLWHLYPQLLRYASSQRSTCALSLTKLQQAIARLRAYIPPPTVYQSMPLSRRAAVLILLFADTRGDLRVIITMRASTLSSYSGQAALPGGHAEADEVPWETARREASEEIGLPTDDARLPKPFKVEHLCRLPTNLAKTELVVSPCVAFLHSHDEATGEDANVGEQLIPRLDAKEVAAVFSAPFHNFLSDKDEVRQGESLPGKPSDWYQGLWTDWHQSRWRMHQFFVPVTNQIVTKPKKNKDQQVTADRLADQERYKVFGMTARILVDAARVAYGQEPDYEHNSHFGDEDMIVRLRRIGRLGDLRERTDELTKEDLARAAKI